MRSHCVKRVQSQFERIVTACSFHLVTHTNQDYSWFELHFSGENTPFDFRYYEIENRKTSAAMTFVIQLIQHCKIDQFTKYKENWEKKNHLHCCNQKCIIYNIFCMKIDFVLISNGMGLFTSWNYCCLPFKPLFAFVYPLDVLSFRKCVPLMRWINKYSQCIVNMRPQQKWYFLLFCKLGIFLESDLSNLLNNRHHAWMSNNVIY